MVVLLVLGEAGYKAMVFLVLGSWIDKVDGDFWIGRRYRWVGLELSDHGDVACSFNLWIHHSADTPSEELSPRFERQPDGPGQLFY